MLRLRDRLCKIPPAPSPLRFHHFHPGPGIPAVPSLSPKSQVSVCDGIASSSLWELEKGADMANSWIAGHSFLAESALLGPDLV